MLKMMVSETIMYAVAQLLDFFQSGRNGGGQFNHGAEAVDRGFTSGCGPVTAGLHANLNMISRQSS
jgi:hypothetical protein